MTDPAMMLGSATAVAALVVPLTRLVRDAFPSMKDASRTVLFTFVAGPALAVAACFAGFTPADVTWREAAAMGLQASVLANGLYASGKAITEKKDSSEPAPAPTVTAAAPPPPPTPIESSPRN
jgi:hypothetical protein